MSVMERKREIDLQALGLKSIAVQKMIFVEGLFMAIIGNLNWSNLCYSIESIYEYIWY